MNGFLTVTRRGHSPLKFITLRVDGAEVGIFIPKRVVPRKLNFRLLLCGKDESFFIFEEEMGNEACLFDFGLS